MDIPTIAKFAKIKGLRLVGTGDFTHPKWLEELKRDLVEVEGTGLYAPAFDPDFPVRFMITTEVCTIFKFREKLKKIHHVIFAPEIESAEQVNERLAKWGDLTVDGRPTLATDASALVEEVMEVSSYCEVIPAHAWTPWFSIFGAFSGFDSVRDCYQDQTDHIHALETGLSSDPPMNWRLSQLDRYVLVSNSDSHSAWPWRIGREANVFELEELAYREIVDAIRKKDRNKFKLTIETDPAYGKYHWTGHRACGVSLPPTEAIRLGNKCPKCGRRLTKGVEQRVEELADRPARFVPPRAIPYVHLLPLSEIIATIYNIDSVSSRRVWAVYNELVKQFGDEYAVLLDVPREQLEEVADPALADAIIRVREGRVRVVPGYDGVYGRLVFEELPEAEGLKPSPLTTLESFL